MLAGLAPAARRIRLVSSSMLSVVVVMVVCRRVGLWRRRRRLKAHLGRVLAVEEVRVGNYWELSICGWLRDEVYYLLTGTGILVSPARWSPAAWARLSEEACCVGRALVRWSWDGVH